MTTILILLSVGLVAGFLSGLVGIGGGLIMIPVLIYFLNYSQQQAQGTVLFMFLLPISILGVMNYYKAGFIEDKTALIMSVTFVVGGYFGSKLAISLDQKMIKQVFGAMMIALGIKMLLGR